MKLKGPFLPESLSSQPSSGLLPTAGSPLRVKKVKNSSLFSSHFTKMEKFFTFFFTKMDKIRHFFLTKIEKIFTFYTLFTKMEKFFSYSSQKWRQVWLDRLCVTQSPQKAPNFGAISEPFGQWLLIRSPAPKFGAQWGP